MTHYYALTDDEHIVDLGEHKNFNRADERAPKNTHWIFDQAGLEQVRDDIYTLIGD